MASPAFTRRSIPPCPDPAHYVLVCCKHTYYWRLKRGTIRPALLNERFKENAALTKVCGPAVKRIRQLLWEHIEGLQTGRAWAKMCSLLGSEIKATGMAGYAPLIGLELQPDYPLAHLLTTHYRVWKADGMIHCSIPIEPGTVKRHNMLVTDFVLQLILVQGDPTVEGALRLYEECSELYSFTATDKRDCLFSIPTPTAAPWMLLLKVSCFEGAQAAAHSKHYAMRVITAGGGE